MNEPVEQADGPPSQRSGDPLTGLWHWTDHPLARFGITVGVLVVLVLLFIGLGQIMF